MTGSIYTVAQVNSYIKNMFTQDFALNQISIQGEVSNCKYHPTGHIYFTLKDERSALACVMFAGNARSLNFRLAEGQQVVARGSVNVYERDGKYQLYASEINRAGVGDLYRRFEEMKLRLEEMGMFDSCYKQKIPRYGMRIGIVTASSGAAIQDIMQISRRRNPYVQLFLQPVLVQGEQAPESIAAGIARMDSLGMDCLIVGRGGGSMEDLWAFNEEVVARAVFACETPVISAVGHETDVTITDYVADLRAPTPSAAAELAVFDYRQFIERLQECDQRMIRRLEAALQRNIARSKELALRLKLQHPGRKLDQQKLRSADLRTALDTLMDQKVQRMRHRLELQAEKMSGLSPLSRLTGGYAYVSRDGSAVRRIGDLKDGDRIAVRMKDGTAEARILSKELTDEDRGKL